jgi:hypothetical protein
MGMSLPAHKELDLLAAGVYQHMRSGSDHGVPIGEESVTDTAMLSLASRFMPYDPYGMAPGGFPLPPSTQVLTQKFTNAEERVNGADWALLFVDRTTLMLMYLQAKLLYSWGGYTKRRQYQVERLRDGGLADGYLTGFVFYNGPVIGSSVAARAASGSRLRAAPCSCSHSLGCTVVPSVLADRRVGSVPTWNNTGIGATARRLACLACPDDCRPTPSRMGGRAARSFVDDVRRRLRQAVVEVDGTPDDPEQVSDRLRAFDDELAAADRDDPAHGAVTSALRERDSAQLREFLESRLGDVLRGRSVSLLAAWDQGVLDA